MTMSGFVQDFSSEGGKLIVAYGNIIIIQNRGGLGRGGGMLPQEILKFTTSEI